MVSSCLRWAVRGYRRRGWPPFKNGRGEIKRKIGCHFTYDVVPLLDSVAHSQDGMGLGGTHGNGGTPLFGGSDVSNKSPLPQRL